MAAGTIAGATAWAQADPAPPADRSEPNAADRKAGKGQQDYLTIKLTSANIENYSLRSVDFAKGQVPTFAQFQKLDEAFKTYRKHIGGVKYEDLKAQLAGIAGDLNAVKGELDTIKGELGDYVKTTDADARYVKVNDAISGHGQVFTASKEGSGADPIPLVGVPGLFDIDIVPGEQSIKITNVGGGDLDFSACAGIGQSGALQPGDSVSCATGEHTEVIQLVTPSQVATVTFNSVLLVAAGNVRLYSAQVVVGEP